MYSVMSYSNATVPDRPNAEATVPFNTADRLPKSPRPKRRLSSMLPVAPCIVLLATCASARSRLLHRARAYAGRLCLVLRSLSRSCKFIPKVLLVIARSLWCISKAVPEICLLWLITSSRRQSVIAFDEFVEIVRSVLCARLYRLT